MIIHIRKSKILFLSALLSILPACGFHLAGSGGGYVSNLANASVQGVASSGELVRFIEEDLRLRRIDVVGIDQAAALVNILSEKTEKIVLSVDSDGKAREFELILHVTFDTKRPDNSYLLREKSIRFSRDFIFDKRDLLGADEEEQKLFSEMRRDAAKFIVYRLQTIEN